MNTLTSPGSNFQFQKMIQFKIQKMITNSIRNQIRHADCVLMLAGLYSSYSYWIQKEIEVASEELRKPIIAVQPWSAKKDITVG